MVKQRMLDTDTFSYILKRRQPVASKAKAYARRHGGLAISIITYYEVLRGLKYVNATRQLREVEKFAKTNVIYPLDLKACRIAADIHATLRGAGKLIEDADLLIAAIALANDCVLVTNNTAHYQRIPNLERIGKYNNSFLQPAAGSLTDLRRVEEKPSKIPKGPPHPGTHADILHPPWTISAETHQMAVDYDSFKGKSVF